MNFEERGTTKDEYERIVGQVYPILSDKISSVVEEQYRDFFKKILEVAERSLRSLLFRCREFDFSKKIREDDIQFWLEKISLILISYSYFCEVSVKEWFGLKEIYLKDIPLDSFFRKSLSYYNKIFDKNLSWEEINYYGSGYREAIQKRDSVSEKELQKIIEKDYRIAGSELLAGIWGQDIDKEKERGMFLGKWIKEAFRKMIIPYLEKITEAKESFSRRRNKN